MSNWPGEQVPFSGYIFVVSSSKNLCNHLLISSRSLYISMHQLKSYTRTSNGSWHVILGLPSSRPVTLSPSNQFSKTAGQSILGDRFIAEKGTCPLNCNWISKEGLEEIQRSTESRPRMRYTLQSEHDRHAVSDISWSSVLLVELDEEVQLEIEHKGFVRQNDATAVLL